jgi:hypothetical protein
MEVRGQLHALAALPPGINRGTHWVGGWLGSTTSLDVVEKTDFFAVPGPNTGSSLYRLMIELHYVGTTK